MNDVEFARKNAFESKETVSETLILSCVLRGQVESGAGAIDLARARRSEATQAGNMEDANSYDAAIRYMLHRGWHRG